MHYDCLLRLPDIHFAVQHVPGANAYISSHQQGADLDHHKSITIALLRSATLRYNALYVRRCESGLLNPVRKGERSDIGMMCLLFKSCLTTTGFLNFGIVYSRVRRARRRVLRDRWLTTTHSSTSFLLLLACTLLCL